VGGSGAERIQVLETRLRDIGRMRLLSKQRDERRVERLNMLHRNKGCRK
jgi:hypothetical protein